MTNRRTFIRNGSLLALAGFVRPSSLFASALGGGKITLTQTDREILEFIARYSTDQRLVGAAVLAKLRGINSPVSTRILVEVSDPGRLFAVFSTGPFSQAHAAGNVISFRHQGVAYTIENLMRDDFAERLASLASPESGQNVAFAHDALVYDPLMRRLSDPHGAAASSEITLLSTGLAGDAAVKTALRGIAEANETGLEQGAHFGRWSAGILASAGRCARSGLDSQETQLT